MTRGICVLLLAALASCAQQPIYQPVDVSVPMTVPCAAPTITQPNWPLRSVAPQALLTDKVKMALAELELRKAYEAELESAVKACAP